MWGLQQELSKMLDVRGLDKLLGAVEIVGIDAHP